MELFPNPCEGKTKSSTEIGSGVLVFKKAIFFFFFED